MTDCIFCKISNKELFSFIVYEDDYCLSFLDLIPGSEQGGHLLLIPKKHYELLIDIPDKDLEHLAKALKKITKALLKFGKGVNILQNNKKVAGQAIPHAHFHLMPRFPNDGIKGEQWSKLKYDEGQMKRTAEHIKKLL